MSRIRFRFPTVAPRPARYRWTPTRTRGEVESLLREIAFVLHATQTTRGAMARPRSRVSLPS
jgi:hypothetical protein